MAACEVDRRCDQFHHGSEDKRGGYGIGGGLVEEQNQDGSRNTARSDSGESDCQRDDESGQNFHSDQYTLCRQGLWEFRCY